MNDNLTRRIVALVPVLLGVLGAIIPLVGGGFTAWGLALAWLVTFAVVVAALLIARPDPPTRVALDLIGLGLTLVVLMPLGGWWFVPAVVVQLLIDKGRASAARPSTA